METFGSVLAQRCLGRVSEVNGIFSNRDDLPSTSGGPRAIAIAYNVSGVSWASLTNNSKGLFFFLFVFVVFFRLLSLFFFNHKATIKL